MKLRKRLVGWVLLLFVVVGCDVGGGTAPTSTPTGASLSATEEASPKPVAQTTGTAAPGETPTGVVSADAFQNPVFRNDFPDPHVIKVGDTYYAYATNATSRNVQTASSTDLVNWKLLPDALPAPGPWARLGGGYVWAPEVMEIDGKYLLYYTARDKASNRQCVGVAIADKPNGPFKDSSDKAFVCQADEGGTIDASPFRDGDKLYLYYKNDGNCCSITTRLYVQEMAPDGLSLVGEPTSLVQNDKLWEGRVVEAPTMWKHEDKYYLFYSGNDYAGPPYAVGYANCESPTGPCQDAEENPILASRMTEKPLVIGPGHQTLLLDDDGETWMVYHVWEVTSAGLRGSRRFMWIDKVEWTEGKPQVKGPTSGPQEKP